MSNWSIGKLAPIVGLATLVSGILAANVEAQSYYERNQAKQARQAVVRHFDSNSDGVLNKRERNNAKAAIHNNFNTNGFRPSPYQRGLNRQPMVNYFDKNGDGVLNKRERIDAKNTMQNRFDNRRHWNNGSINTTNNAANWLDTNGDGSVNEHERMYGALRMQQMQQKLKNK